MDKKSIPNPVDVLVRGYAALGLLAKVEWKQTLGRRWLSVELSTSEGSPVE